MDLCADQLLAHLSPEVSATDLAPDFRRVFGRWSFNTDRILNRHVFQPRIVRRAAPQFDFVHVVDHSYAHLVNSVPPGRAGVYCHDLDAFRSILNPTEEPRPWWFRRLAWRTLRGLQNAAVVFHSTADVGQQIRKACLVAPDRLVQAPYGVSSDFTSDPTCKREMYLLHVGGNIPRKRIDVLLDLFAAARARVPGVRLVQVGGPWPQHLAERIARLGIESAVTQVRDLTRTQLADLYRRASIVLVPSDAEGFGLPVIEALACGAVVVASDIPTLREAGGEAAIYRPVADVPQWADTVVQLLDGSMAAPPLAARLAWAGRFTWKRHAEIIRSAYERLAS